MSPRILLVLAGVAFLLFAGIVLNATLDRDALTCEPDRCVAQRDRFLAFGGPSGPREFHPREVKRVEIVAPRMRYGSVWLFELEGHEDLLLRLDIDDAQARELHRWFESPAGRFAFEGPRASRNYPFVALLAGIGSAALIAAAKGRKKA